MNGQDQGEIRHWRQIPVLGRWAFASFVVCVATGIMLIPAYKPAAAMDSLALLLLKNPAGSFVRSVHFWSAQAFLILTLAHLADHLLQRSETRIRFGVWLRLGLSVPVVVAVMLSGFLLRGDAGATQALQVLRSLLGLVPLFGAALSRLLTGYGSDLTTVYLHHAATATLILWLVTIEHARRILPRAQTILWSLPPLLLASLFLVPGLDGRASAAEKGPWYLVGLQELLHWLRWPRVALWALLAGLLLLVLLPKFSQPLRSNIKSSMTLVAVGYGALTLVGLGFRGHGWELESPAAVWTNQSRFVSFKAYAPPDAKLLEKTVPMVAGQREGCLACHDSMTGFAAAHDPKSIGCASCHLGNPFTLNPALAHAGMTLTPGNLSVVDLTCGASNCHNLVSVRVRGSLMNTMSGVVSVDKFVFGENTNLDATFNIAALRHAPADTHLRQLCASCHLGQDKQHPLPIDASSRGGGCSACHLRYDSAALAELGPGETFNPLHHPDVSIRVAEQACFGCHSRSGRIATNYEGWH